MRVLCINGTKPGDKTYYGFSITGEECIEEGERYTVIDEMVLRGVLSYRLEEKGSLWYKSWRFVPISDIDETERIEEVLEQIFVKRETV